MRSKVHRVRDIRTFLDEDLRDAGLVASRGLTEDLALHRHGAPADELLPFVADDVLEDLHRRLALAGVWGEKNKAGTVVALGRQVDTLLRHFLAKEFVGHLHKDPGTVASRRVRTACAAVIHLRIHRQRLLDNVMRALPFEMGNETHAASVFFMGRMPKTLGFWPAKR